ncbi:MAG: hypothetical protein ACRCTE_09695 [Cellulosilyticaceae bacterium]
MKRTKFVAGLLALGMVLMGTGYAYWTDTLKVQTTASTGELEIKFVDITPYGQYSNESGWTVYDGVTETGAADKGGNLIKTPTRNNGSTVSADTGYNDLGNDELAEYEKAMSGWTNIDSEIARDAEGKTLGDVSNIVDEDGNLLAGDYSKKEIIVSDVMEMTVSNMYPGYAEFFQADILNTGTIGAQLSAITCTVEYDGTESQADEAILKKMVGINFDILRDLQIEFPETFGDVIQNPDNIFEVGGRKFVRLDVVTDDVLKRVIEDLDAKGTPITIKADGTHKDRLDIYFGIAMDPDYEGQFTTGHIGATDAKGTDKDSQLSGDIKVTLTLGWDQINTKSH